MRSDLFCISVAKVHINSWQMNILENSVFLMTNDLQKQRLRTFVDLHVYATPNSIIKNQTMYNSTFTQFKKNTQKLSSVFNKFWTIFFSRTKNNSLVQTQKDYNKQSLLVTFSFVVQITIVEKYVFFIIL